jgi:hypothetical protein
MISHPVAADRLFGSENFFQVIECGRSHPLNQPPPVEMGSVQSPRIFETEQSSAARHKKNRINPILGNATTKFKYTTQITHIARL